MCREGYGNGWKMYAMDHQVGYRSFFWSVRTERAADITEEKDGIDICLHVSY